MDAALNARFLGTLSRRSIQLLVVLLRFSRDDGKEKLLLPFRRLAGAIEPRIGGLPWTTQSGHNQGSGIRSKRISEGHRQILPDKKKYAMQKIILALCLQCGQSKRMTTRYLIQYELDGQWITCATRKTFDAAKAKAKAERKAMNGAHETSVIREGDPEILRRKTCEQFQLA